MMISKLKRGAPIVGVLALAALLALPVVMMDNPYIRVVPAGDRFVLPVGQQFDDILYGREGYVVEDLQGPVMNVCWIRAQFADADTLGGNNTVLAAPVLKVSETKMLTALYGRPQMSAVYGDTSGIKLVVPGMSAGDRITGVIYMAENSVLTTKWRDMTDSTWYHRDTIMCGAYTDSGSVLVLFQDRTD